MEAAINSCPAGWHLPIFIDIYDLTELLFLNDIAGKLIESGTSH
jgi:hypothetical protein